MPTIAIRDVASSSLIRSRVSCLNDQSPNDGLRSQSFRASLALFFLFFGHFECKRL